MIDVNINEAVKPFFDRLDLDEIPFEYNVNKKRFITKHSFTYDDADPDAYFMVVKVFGKVGTVVIGTSDGINFTELETLGQIVYDGNKWTTA